MDKMKFNKYQTNLLKNGNIVMVVLFGKESELINIKNVFMYQIMELKNSMPQCICSNNVNEDDIIELWAFTKKDLINNFGIENLEFDCNE